MTEKSLSSTQAAQIVVRRKQILDAAVKVFAAKGVHRATIREIARTAELADGTIYNYFENKNALLLGILDRLNETEQREAHFAQAGAVGLDQFLELYLKQRLDRLTEDGLDVLRVLFSELLVNAELRESYYQDVFKPTTEVGESYLRQRHAQGAPVFPDPAMATRVLGGAVIGLIIMRLLGDEYLQAHWNELPDAMAAVIRRGMMPKGGDDNDSGSAAESGESTV
jgi:TetR/AcrR family fatty acid metabolism transcriptional regulator